MTARMGFDLVVVEEMEFVFMRLLYRGVVWFGAEVLGEVLCNVGEG